MEPKPPSPRISQQQQTVEQQTIRETRSGLEFGSAEELIRYDAAQTQPSDTLAQRVKEAVDREPMPKRSWWDRLLGR